MAAPHAMFGLPNNAVTIYVFGAFPIVLIGCLLCLLIVGIGLPIVRDRGKLARTSVLMVATIVAGATLILAIWAAVSYSERVKNWDKRQGERHWERHQRIKKLDIPE